MDDSAQTPTATNSTAKASSNDDFLVKMANDIKQLEDQDVQNTQNGLNDVAQKAQSQKADDTNSNLSGLSQSDPSVMSANQSVSDDSNQSDDDKIDDVEDLVFDEEEIDGLAEDNNQPVSSSKLGKEASPTTITEPENVKYKEIGAELEHDNELEQWVKEIPDAQTINIRKPVKDDYGQILIQASQVPKPNIVLPINQVEMEKALHHKIVDSIRWLYEWAKRNIKLYPKRVFYQKKEE